MKKTYLKSIGASTSLTVLLGLLAANQAGAAVIYYNPSGGATQVTSGSTYTWDTVSTQWDTTASTLGGGVEVWNSTAAACFVGGNTFSGTITVDIAASGVNLPGLFNGALAPDGVFLTINGPGVMNWNAGTGGLDSSGSDGGTTTINAVMGGAGQIETEGSASLFLNANNTYTGGTLLGGAGGVNFSTSQAFGTGTITWGRSAMVLASQGTQALALANNMATAAGDTLTFVGGANAATTINGTTTLATGTSTLQVNAGTPLTLAGNIGQVGTANFVKTGAGQLIMSGNGSWTGTTTVTAGTLSAGPNGNTPYGNSSQIIMNGGNLDLAQQTLSTNGTLSLTASSSIDFSGYAQISFANSAGVTWTSAKLLNLLNYDGSLQVGVDATGLTSAQLAEIEVDGNSTTIGQAYIDGNGFVQLVPEPSSLALGALGGLSMLWMIKRRKVA
jgi:autotransporter-associated beta strand protein